MKNAARRTSIIELNGLSDETKQHRILKPEDRLITCRNPHYKDSIDIYTQTQYSEETGQLEPENQRSKVSCRVSNLKVENPSGLQNSNSTNKNQLGVNNNFLGNNLSTNNSKPSHMIGRISNYIGNFWSNKTEISPTASDPSSSKKLDRSSSSASNTNLVNKSASRRQSKASSQFAAGNKNAPVFQNAKENIANFATQNYSMFRNSSVLSSDFKRFQQTYADSERITDLYELDEDGEIMKQVVLIESFEDLPPPVLIVSQCMTAIDEKEAFCQLLIKCAAILNKNQNEFSPKMLKNIIPGLNSSINGQKKFEKFMKQLIDEKIFEKFEKDDKDGNASLKPSVTAGLQASKPQNLNENILYKFANPLLQEIAAGLWLDSAAKNLHHECIDYLERQVENFKFGMTTDTIVNYKLNQTGGSTCVLQNEFSRINEEATNEYTFDCGKSFSDSETSSLASSQSNISASKISISTVLSRNEHKYLFPESLLRVALAKRLSGVFRGVLEALLELFEAFFEAFFMLVERV